MIFTGSALRAAAQNRLPGYLEAALSMGTPLGNDQYDFTPDQMAQLAKYRKPIGLGDAVKAVIHAGLDMLPMPETTRTKVKGCAGCAKRAARLNAMMPNINPLDKLGG